MNGCVTPFSNAPSAAAHETTVRFHSNSASMGTTKAPNEFRAPMVTNAMNMQVATTNHP